MDDILHLLPVEVGGCNLILADKHNLFAIGLFVVLHISVADCDERKANLLEFASSKVGNVPTQLVAANLLALLAFSSPLGRRPIYPYRQMELMLGKEIFCFVDVTINFTSFDRYVALSVNNSYSKTPQSGRVWGLHRSRLRCGG